VRFAVVLAGIVGVASIAQAITVEKLLGGGRLVAYTPLGFDPGRGAPPRASVLRADADTLYRLGFRAVTTYGASRSLVPVCRFFKRRGFRTVLVGVEDPRDRAELGRARLLRRCADGYVVGTEGLAAGRYTREELEAAITRLRQTSGRPVTTREPLASYGDDQTLARVGDWLFPTVEPWPAGHHESQDACGWTIFAYRDLAARAPAGVPTVVAETGLPTEGAPAALEHYQRAFFQCLESRAVAFAYFEAFDQPWRSGDVGPHWGLFRADASPKIWAAQQMHPALVARRGRREVHGRVRGVPPRAARVVAYTDDGQWTLAGRATCGRRGKWRIAVTPNRSVVLYLVTAAWEPPPAPARRPTVDRAQVLAERELPAM
jgi:hypothetical protein